MRHRDVSCLQGHVSPLEMGPQVHTWSLLTRKFTDPRAGATKPLSAPPDARAESQAKRDGTAACSAWRGLVPAGSPQCEGQRGPWDKGRALRRPVDQMGAEGWPCSREAGRGGGRGSTRSQVREQHASETDARLWGTRANSASGQRPRTSFSSCSFSEVHNYLEAQSQAELGGGGRPPCPAASSRTGPSRAAGGTGWGSCRCRASWGGSPSRTCRGRQEPSCQRGPGAPLRPPPPPPVAPPRPAVPVPRAQQGCAPGGHTEAPDPEDRCLPRDCMWEAGLCPDHRV